MHLVLSISILGGILSLIRGLPVRPSNSYLPSSDMQVSWEAAWGLKKAEGQVSFCTPKGIHESCLREASLDAHCGLKGDTTVVYLADWVTFKMIMIDETTLLEQGKYQC